MSTFQELMGSNYQRPRRIKFMKLNDVSLVDRGAGDGCNVILAKRLEPHRLPAAFSSDVPRAMSESDRVGAQDDRTAEEQAADFEKVVSACIASPPAASETVEQWAARVFDGEEGKLDSPECAAVRAIFAAYRRHANEPAPMMKAIAACQLDNLADQMLAENPKLGSIQKAYVAACKTQDGSELYAALRGRPVSLATPIGKILFEIAKSDQSVADEANAEEPGEEESGEDGGSDQADAHDALLEIADQLDPGLSAAKRFLIACQRRPDLYQVARGYGGHVVTPERA